MQIDFSFFLLFFFSLPFLPLRVHNPALPVVQCLKTDISYIVACISGHLWQKGKSFVGRSVPLAWTASRGGDVLGAPCAPLMSQSPARWAIRGSPALGTAGPPAVKDTCQSLC